MKKWLMIIACLMAVSVLKADSVDYMSLTGNAEFGIRDKFGVAILNNSIYVIGGTLQDATYYNDIWKSNNGITWELITSEAPWVDSAGICSIGYNGYLYRLSSEYPQSGAVYKSIDGINWDLIATNPWGSKITSQMAIVFNDYIYTIGGINGVTMLNDIYRTKNGITWETVNLTPQIPNRVRGSLCIHKNYIYMTSGWGTEYGPPPDYPLSQYYNDVWRSEDGIDWELMTGNAEFVATDTNNIFSINNKLYVFCGTDGISESQIWESLDDGITWTKISNNIISSRREFGFIEINDKQMVLAGYHVDTDINDVWMITIFEESPTITPSFTAMPTVETPTITVTATPSITKTITVTSTITLTHSLTHTKTPTITLTPVIFYTDTVTRTSTPTRTITNTITTTLTNTPIVTATVTSTVTSVTTQDPILRYVSTDYDNHKTTLRVEWTKYSANNLQYILTVYDPTYQHESTTLLNNSADISPDLEWLTHDIIGLRYDYCYNLGVTITSTDWSEPVYANTLVVCPYESPTPFAGTPTATNTPDCNMPTSTPTNSPVITIAVTVGYALFENNDNATPEATYTGSATHKSGTFTYKVFERAGNVNNVAVMGTTNGAPDWLSFHTATTSTQLTVGFWFQQLTGTSSQQYIAPYAGNTDTYGGNVYLLAGTQSMSATSYRYLHYLNGAVGTYPWIDTTLNHANWYYSKTIYTVATIKHCVYDVDGNMLVNIGRGNSTQFSAALYGGLACYQSNGYALFDDWSITTSPTITVSGLGDGMLVVIIDASNNTIFGQKANGTGTVTFDTTYKILPIAGKFLIYGADNNALLYADTETKNILGGDVWDVTVTP